MKYLYSLLLIVIMCSGLMAQTRYVRTTGNNNNDGTTWATAWAHPNRAQSQLTTSGFTLVIGAGLYDTVQFIPPAAGGALTSYIGAGRDSTILYLSRPQALTWTSIGGNLWTTTFDSPGGGVTMNNGNYVAFYRDGVALAPRALNAENRYSYDINSNLATLYSTTNPNSSSWRVSWRPIMITGAQQSNILIEGVDIRHGSQRSLMITADFSGFPKSDSIYIRNCDFSGLIDLMAAHNTAFITSGLISPPNEAQWSNDIQVVGCRFYGPVETPSTGVHAGAAIEYYFVRDSRIDSNEFIGPIGNAIALKHGCYPDYGVKALNWSIKYNKFSDISDEAIWIGNKNGNMDIIGNIFERCENGIGQWTSAPCGVDPVQGNVFIKYNNFIDCQNPISISPANTIGNNKIMYNIFFDTLATVATNTEFTIGFRLKSGEAPLEAPATETYWAGGINYNMYYSANGGEGFEGRFTSNSGFNGIPNPTWAQWTQYFDQASVTGVNPLFASSQTGDYSRPTSTTEFTVTEYGRTWTRYGAWQPTGSGCATDVPVLLTPVNGASNLNNPIVFDWSDVSGATSYTIHIATDAAFNNIIVNQSPTLSTYTSSVFQDGTQYYWRVLATSSCGVSPWASYRIFNMACTSTPSITLLSPSNLATNQPLSVTLDWADASASLYQIQLSLAPAFTTNMVDQTTASSTYDISSLGYATTYYWRVRGQNACGWGSWSSRSFTTTQAPTGSSQTISDTVAASGDDATYENGVFSSTARLSFGNAGPAVCTTYTIHTMTLAQGDPCDSAFMYFTSRATTAGTVCRVRIRVELSGNPSILTSGSMASRTYSTSYVDWEIPAWGPDVVYKSPNLKPLIDELTTLTAVTKISFKFADNLSSWDGFRTAYPYDFNANSAPILTVHFPPLNTAPTVPILSTPTANGSTNSLTPNLIINNSTDVDGDVIQYIFEIASDANFDTILVQSPFVAQGTTTTSWTSTVNLTNGVIYYWRARAYDGTVYTEWSSGNEFIVATTRLIDINQAWRDSTNGVIDSANGFLAGDVVRLTSNIITPDNWGIIINRRAVTLNADGYTIQCNNITVPSIVNPSFETGTGTSADGWDFSAAPNAQRLAGQYDEIAEYSNPSTLMTGNYSLRFQVPCSTQTVVSSSAYTLDANRNWAICAAYYNQIQNPSLDPSTDHVRITIGFVSVDGDTLFSSEFLRGMMYRGPEPIVVHYKTTTSTTGKIFFRLRGTSTITSTNSFIWVDDVKIIPFAPFSIGVAIDTTEQRAIAQGNVRAYDAGTDAMIVLTGTNISRLFSGYPTTSNTGDSVTIRNAVLRNNSAGGYNAFGLFIGYSADSISLYNSDVLTVGPNCHNIFSGSAFYNNVFYNTFEVNAPYGLARESVPSTNIDFVGGKGSGARGSVIYGNTFSGSIWCSIVIQNRCDANIDGIDTYPVPIIRKNTFYCTTKLTNGFVVDFTGQGGFVFDSNSVFGSGEYHGTGVHIQYQNPACEQWVVIRDNYISVSPDTINQEYPYGTLAYGIQLEQAPRCSVLTNYVVAVTDHIKDPAAMALRINDGGVPSRQVIAGNTFVGISNDSANSSSACLLFGSPEGWDYDGITKVIEFGYNTLNTNSAWIRGFTKIRNWQPNNNVFVINDSLPIMPDFTPMSSDPLASGVPTDIRFLNNRFGSDSAKTVFKNAYIRSTYGSTSAKALSQWFYVHQVGVSVASLNTGLFLPDIEVIVYDNIGGLQDVDTTDVYGKVYLLAREFENKPLTSTYNVNTDKIYYNPFTIIARTLNQALAETLIVSVDTLIHINMNLDLNQYPTVSSPPFFDIFKPTNNKVIPPLFNADTMAHFIVYDDFGIKDINVYLRGGTLNKNIFSSSYGVGSRPSFQEISFAYDTQYEDTLAQYIVFIAEDDSLDVGKDSMLISIPIGTNITIAFGGKYITDNKLDVTSPTVNLSSATSFRTSPTGSRGWLMFDMQALKGDSLPAIVDIVSSTLRLYNNERNGSGTIGIHDVFKNGVTHTSMSYNRFDRVGLLEWGVAGANSTGDYPTCGYNTTDAGGCDRSASALSVVSPILNTYNTWTIPDSTLQFMFDGTKPNNGWLFVATGTSNCTYYTVEGASPPLATITYQVPRPIPVGNLYNPVLAIIGSKSITENQLLSFTVSASDADLTTPNFLIAEATLPTGAVLTDNDNGTALFSWTPLYTQSGIYNVLFIATDGQKTDSEMVTITVVEFGDRAPIITGVTNRSVSENSLLSFTVTGSDADGDLIDISATGLPSGATFIYDSYLMSANFFWTPTYTQAGSYNVTFIVTELTSGTLSTSYPFVITVNNTNRAPVLASIGNKSVNENVLLSFNMTATDADNEVLTFSGTNMPAGANITNVSNGTAQFNWQPNLSQSGVYNVTINVSDGITTDFEVIQITVNNVSGTTTVTISGTVNVEDAYLRPSQPNANYSNYTGGSHGMYVYTDATTTGRGMLRFNLTGALPENAIIVNTYIKFTVFQYNAAGTIYAARVFQPWVEGNSNGGTTAGVSYNHFDITGAKTWTLAGAKSTSDAGVDNTTGTIGTHFDAALTPSGFVTPTSTGVHNLILQNSLVQGWRTGTIANNGVVLYSAGNFAIYQSETATSTNRPELIIEYTTSAPGKPHRRFPLRGLNSGVLK